MKFYLSMCYFIILKTNVESVILDIKPSTNIQPGAPSLTIRCQPTTDEVSSIFQLDIKNHINGTDGIIGTVQVGKSPELGPGFGSPKYTVTGSIQDFNSVSTAFLQIVIQEPDGNDKGDIGCEVTGTSSIGNPVTVGKRYYVTVQENPSNINMYITPQSSEYDINTSISMACNGNVGNPPKTWQWQTRRFPASTQWVRLTDGVVNKFVMPPTGASWFYHQQTILTYTVASQDDGLQIRCILDNSEEFSKNFTINLKVSPVTSSVSILPTTSSVNPSENVTKLSAPPVTSSVSTSPTTSSDNPTGCAKQFRVTDTTAVTVLGVLVALCFFI